MGTLRIKIAPLLIKTNIALGLKRMTGTGLILIGLSACAPAAYELCLYNAQNIDVSITANGSGGHSVQLSAPANKTLNIKAGLYRQFIMHTASGARCYQVPNISRLDRRWYYSGMSNYKLAFVKLADDNKIYLYDKSAHGDHAFYTTKVPEQPAGFPLEPTAMKECV